MCGIVGAIGNSPASPILLDALRRLEYRGYDSAGIATLVNGRIDSRRASGKLSSLGKRLVEHPLEGTTGIGHTRWATHGAPTENNAHPHGTVRVSVVHNGIIENHDDLRIELEAAGQVFASETDSETVAQLVDLNLQQGLSPQEAARQALLRLRGAYALGMIFTGHCELLIGARHGAPLAVGFGENEMFLGSDSIALAPLTRRISYLQDGDLVVLSRNGATFFDVESGETRQREILLTASATASIGKDGYRHFMEKELHEHPSVVGQTLHRLVSGEHDADPKATIAIAFMQMLGHAGVDEDAGSHALPSLDDKSSRPVFVEESFRVHLPKACRGLERFRRVTMTACGSAYYAGLVGRYWIESLAGVPVDVDVASELRYRNPPMEKGGLALVVSQSGETADTLAALRILKAREQEVLCVVNVPESTMARESGMVLQTVAGAEIGVASTKAFTAQLAVLACIAIAMARSRGRISDEEESRLVSHLTHVPGHMQEVLHLSSDIERMARPICEARDVLFLGRGLLYPIAMEGALKLKEISYIHAEGYAAGEMKHGPIALIDKSVPIVALAPSGPLFEKTASNLQEASARGGKLMVFTDAQGAVRLRASAAELVILPTVDPFVAPILYAVAVQMLAYQVAIHKGTDVDQPRNLAKSVTVE